MTMLKPDASLEKPRRQKRAILDEEKIAIALKRFEDLPTHGKFKPIEDIAEEFGRSEAVVTRAIIAAFQDGLVAVERTDRPRKGGGASAAVVDENLSARIRDRFPTLLEAKVVKLPSALKTNEGVNDERKQLLHRYLGGNMAPYVASSLRDGDKVLVGSGLGVGLTLDALVNGLPLRQRRVELISMSGSVFAVGKTSSYFLDADSHVAQFRAAFDLAKLQADGPTMKIFASRLAFHKPGDVQAASNGTPYGEPWVVNDYAFALAGVSVFATNHKFWDFRANKILEPVAQWLGKLEELCRKSERALVADTSNFLFTIPDPKGEPLPSFAGEIESLIDQINSRMLNIGRERLQNLRVALVAGGVDKARAIWAMLTGKVGCNVISLCTDEGVAHELLGYPMSS